MDTFNLKELEKKELQSIDGGMGPEAIAGFVVAAWGAWYSAWYAIGEAYGNYTKNK